MTISDSASKSLSISVVVATRDRATLLRRCLASINHGARAPDELIVVDSVSCDAEQVAREAECAGARLVRARRPGAALAHNLGILAASRGDVIAFTDDDAVVDAGWLEALGHAFSDRSVAAAVGPVFVLDVHPTTLLCPREDFDPATHPVRFSRADPNWFDRLALGAVGLGANLAARRAAFDKYGFFREALGAGAPISGDDSYFLLSLVEGGGVAVNVPAARVFHPPQTPNRLEEVQQSAIAYVVYVLITRPMLRRSILTRLARRLLQGRVIVAGDRRRPAILQGGLAGSLRSAPLQLAAAWRIEHR